MQLQLELLEHIQKKIKLLSVVITDGMTGN